MKIGKAPQWYVTHPSSIKIEDELNIRNSFTNLDNLADDIAANGLYNPLLVRKLSDNSSTPFVLVDGHRRLLAIKKLYETVKDFRMKIFVHVLNISDEEAFDIMAKANLVREDFSPSEKVELVRRYISRGLTQRQIASRLHVSQSWVSHMALLAKLSPKVLASLDSGAISVQSALALVRGVNNIKEQEQLVDSLVKNERKSIKAKHRNKRPGKRQLHSLEEHFTAKAEAAINREERLPMVLVMDLLASALNFAAGDLDKEEFIEKFNRAVVLD